MRLLRRAGLASAALFVGAVTAPHASPPPGPPAAPAPPTAPAPPRAAADFAEPLRLLREARQAWAHIEDCTCVLVRRERVGGRLGPEEVMLMKARREPFRVSLRWVAPPAMAKQEARYVAGPNGVGPIIERLGQEWTAARGRVRVSDAEFDGRECRRVEVIETAGESRIVVHFDRETHLPIRAEWFDGDELREATAFTKMRVNVGLRDEDFAELR